MDDVDMILWDYPIGSEPKYFDGTKSYECIKYRPITETLGLDFDIKLFTEAREYKLQYGVYSNHKIGTKAYREFWKEEVSRCTDGYTAGGYTLTGDNYFFLNYYRMPVVMSVEGKQTSRADGFPMFMSKQYEWFHYVKLAEYFGLDCAALKPRGIGWSEIAASMGVCLYTIKREQTLMYTAATLGYLSNVLEKCWKQINYLNTETEGGLRHVCMRYNTVLHKRASYTESDRTEKGWMSEIEGVVADSASKIRGNRCSRLFFEEAGSDKNLLQKIIQGSALVTVGGLKVGTMFAWGTGGDSGSALKGLSQLFYSPEPYSILPYYNNYNERNEWVYTGFFIPAYKFHFMYLDSRGVTDSKKAKEDFCKKREKYKDDQRGLIEYRSENCFTPEEALIRQGENQFDQIKLIEQLSKIQILKDVEPLPKSGFLAYDTEGKVYWRENVRGDVLMIEPPRVDETGNIFNNLYVAGIDSIDAGKQDSTGQSDVSDFCIVIKRRISGLGPPQYVCMYKARPINIKDAYNTAIRMLEFYNCKAVLENSRISFLMYLEIKNLKDKLLMKRPRSSSQSLTNSKTLYGATPTTLVIRHYLDLITNFVFEYSETINFEEMLDQLIKYNYDNKKKFDIIAAMGMCEIGDEEMTGKPIEERTIITRYQDLGWYIDNNGIKRNGIHDRVQKKNNLLHRIPI